MFMTIGFPWGILVFSFLVSFVLIIYLCILNKAKQRIKKIIILSKKENFDFLTNNYIIVDSILDNPDLIIDFSNDLIQSKQLLSLNIPILLISNFSQQEISEIVKLAKYYCSTIIINAKLETLQKDLERVKKGRIIKIYQ